MDNAYSQKVQVKLAAFFKAQMRSKQMEERLDETEKKIKQVETELKELQISLPLPSLTVNYSGIQVTGGDKSSYLEKALVRQEEKLYRELMQLKILRARLGQRIRDIKQKWEGMEMTIPIILDEEEMLIAKIKFSNREISYREIARIIEHKTCIMRSPNTIKQKIERIMYKIAKELQIT